jgi:2-keto-3-deoxy-L-rhamnonate aldolase RhmA
LKQDGGRYSRRLFPMTAHDLKVSVRAGRRVYGTLIVSPSPRWLDMVAGLGLDFVFLDTEHIALDRAQLSWMCQAYRARGLPALVRIPSPDAYTACMAFDGGASGVIAPYVETVAQVQALRGAARFRPLKGARLEAALQDPTVLESGLQDWLRTENGASLCIINVESVPAVERLDELLAVPDLDAVLIGPHDLSCSLGIPGRYDDPRFDATVRLILRKARAYGVGAGIHSWFGLDRLEAWAAEGLNLIIHRADILALRDGIGTEVAELRRRLGDITPANDADATN